MISKGPALFLAAAMLAAADSHALLINYGTAEEITFRNCVAGNSGCDDVSAPVAFVYGGIPGAAFSAATNTLAGYGTVTGSVALSGTIGAPTLSASATSTPGTRQNTNSVALQSYTYTGTVATTRTFGGTLTYSQTVTGNYPFFVFGGVAATIDLFTLPASMVDVGATPESNFTALFDPFDFPGYSDLGLGQYLNTTSTASGTGAVGVTVTLTPGETVWVWALLQTPATNGGVEDASHTFITGWDNTANLTPAVAVTVPEPATITLLGISLAGLGFLRRGKLRYCRTG